LISALADIDERVCSTSSVADLYMGPLHGNADGGSAGSETMPRRDDLPGVGVVTPAIGDRGDTDPCRIGVAGGVVDARC
jgi:hypothetical protein